MYLVHIFCCTKCATIIIIKQVLQEKKLKKRNKKSRIRTIAEQTSGAVTTVPQRKLVGSFSELRFTHLFHTNVTVKLMFLLSAQKS